MLNLRSTTVAAQSVGWVGPSELTIFEKIVTGFSDRDKEDAMREAYTLIEPVDYSLLLTSRRGL